MKLPRAIERIIDSGGLIVALVVDLILNVICFSVLAPDWLTSVAFISIGIMCVLFIFRSWSKGQKKTYAIFVIIVFFFDLSFTLVATKTQSNSVTIENDSELARLTSQVDAANIQVLALQDQYSKAMKRETMDQINTMIMKAQGETDRLNGMRETRIKSIGEGRAGKAVIKADTVFEAIPQAWADKRFIPLGIFTLIFLGLQLIVASSIDLPEKARPEVMQETEPVKAEPPALEPKLAPIEVITIKPPAPVVEPVQDPSPVAVPEPKPLAPVITATKEQIAEFVKYSWFSIRQRTGAFIVTESVFFDLMKRQGKTYDKEVYTYLINQCKRMDIIDIRGQVKLKDEESVTRLLGGEQTS